MHETLKSSPGGKFMLHRQDCRRSREFLCVVPQTPVPMYMRKQLLGDLGNIDPPHQLSYSETHL